MNIVKSVTVSAEQIYNNTGTKRGSGMSQDNTSIAKTKTQNAQATMWASDDVHRIALRNPALHRMNVVPQIDRGHITSLEGGGMS